METHTFARSLALILAIAVLFLLGGCSAPRVTAQSNHPDWALSVAPFAVTDADNEGQTGEGNEEDQSLPIPLHNIEGTGGSFAVPNALLVNPAPPGQVFGKPSVGNIHVNMGHGKHLEVFSLTETLWGRLELGYALQDLDVGDFF